MCSQKKLCLGKVCDDWFCCCCVCIRNVWVGHCIWTSKQFPFSHRKVTFFSLFRQDFLVHLSQACDILPGTFVEPCADLRQTESTEWDQNATGQLEVQKTTVCSFFWIGSFLLSQTATNSLVLLSELQVLCAFFSYCTLFRLILCHVSVFNSFYQSSTIRVVGTIEPPLTSPNWFCSERELWQTTLAK